MAPPNRHGGGGVSLRTLTIASLASATAAVVVSQVFPPGTVFASALTPVIVAAVSEIMNRPVDRVSALREQRRTMVLEARETEFARTLGEEPSPLRGAPDWAQGAEGFEDEVVTNGHHTGRDPMAGASLHGRQRRTLHPKVWIATGLTAFAIVVAVLTLPELIFGGAVATKHRTTLFGGGHSHPSTSPKESTQTTTTKSETTPTETVPAAPPGETTPTGAETGTDTSTTPTTTETGTSTTPTTTDTGTSTTPLPPQP